MSNKNVAGDTTVGITDSNGLEFGWICGTLMKSKGILSTEEYSSCRCELVVGHDVKKLEKGGKVRLVGSGCWFLGGIVLVGGSCGWVGWLGGVEGVGLENINTVGKWVRGGALLEAVKSCGDRVSVDLDGCCLGW